MERLQLSAAAARRLAAEHGTPCFVQDLGLVRARWHRLRRALGPQVEVLYAVKANPHPEILKALAVEGAGFEVASRGEFEAVLAAGGTASRMAFSGPGKRDAEIEAALAAGVRLNVESRAELERADRIADRLGMDADVNVRVNPPWGVAEERPILGGTQPTQFGVDLDLLPEFAAAAARARRLRVGGLHVFAATNVLDAAVLSENAGRVLDLALAAEREHGWSLQVVDLGGGLGVPYEPGRPPLDVERFGALLAAAARERFGRGGRRLVLEPGRWLVAEAGLFLTRVIDRKRCRGREFVVCDGGINNLLRPALVGQAHPILACGREDAAADGTYDVVGPLCTSLDVLGRDVPLPDPRPGDLLVVGCAGAYGFTESPQLFLSHPVPAQVMLG